MAADDLITIAVSRDDLLLIKSMVEIRLDDDLTKEERSVAEILYDIVRHALASS